MSLIDAKEVKTALSIKIGEAKIWPQSVKEGIQPDSWIDGIISAYFVVEHIEDETQRNEDRNFVRFEASCPCKTCDKFKAKIDLFGNFPTVRISCGSRSTSFGKITRDHVMEVINGMLKNCPNTEAAGDDS